MIDLWKRPKKVRRIGCWRVASRLGQHRVGFEWHNRHRFSFALPWWWVSVLRTRKAKTDD